MGTKFNPLIYGGFDLVGSSGSFAPILTPTATKTGNYTASANELIPCDISGGSFYVQLPTAPTDGTIIQVELVATGASTTLEVKAGGTDKFWKSTGPQAFYLSLNFDCAVLQYQSSTGLWFVNLSSAPYNFANNFPGIDAMTPITNADISIDTTARTLTITPPLGYLRFFIDGGGKVTRFRKTTSIVFGNGSGSSGNNTWTDTSGTWYFYFNSNGEPVTTQVAWTTADFPSVAPVYRVLWNSTLAGANKLVAQYIEYHLNDISADDHQWFHLSGAIWRTGGVMVNNALVSGSPNADGRNTVIGLTTVSNVDDNLEYTVTNSTAGTPWTQDLGNTTAASLNATNSAMFKVFTQDVSGNVSFLPATRFPFAWDSGTNQPQYITSTGTRTAVTNQRFMVYFVYSTQNPVAGDALKVISETTDYTSITNARAASWTDIQNTYSIIGNDFELRPLYRLIFEVHTSSPNTYDVGAKYSVLRETQDLRKTIVSTTTASVGSLPASSVTVVPYGTIASTNAQSALQELSDEKVQLNATNAGQYVSGEYTDTVAAGAVTVDWNNGNVHYMVLGNGATTITLSNPIAGGRYLIYLKQPSSGAAGTITFSPVPIYAGGVVPTLTTTNNAVDVITLSYSTALGKYVAAYNLNLS